MRIPSRWCRSVVLVALALGVQPAHAFRYVSLGSPVPSLALENLEGATARVPGAGQVTVIAFWRPGQQLSDDALADLGALAASLSAKNVDLIAVAESGADREASRARAARLPLRFLLDRDGRMGEAYGIIVFPSTAVIGSDGRLKYYLPSRTPAYRTLVEATVLHARGSVSEEELARRLRAAGDAHATGGETARTAYRRGVELMQEKRYAEARAALSEALSRAPEQLDAELQLGYVQLELREPALALEHFEAILKRNPASPAARVGRGIARLRLGAIDEGIRLLEDAVVLNPEPVRGHWELAQVYEARGDLDRALTHYRWAYRKLRQGRK